MTAAELRARRIALGISQQRLANYLDVPQARVADWERGARTIPDGINSELQGLEDIRSSLVRALLDKLAQDPGAVLRVCRSDEEWWAAAPGWKPAPHEILAVAAAYAAAEATVRPRIVEA